MQPLAGTLRKTKIVKINQIDEAVDLLKNGELVALPTETVYGLAADAQNEIAIQKIFAVKDRPRNHPLILHINSYEQLDYWAQNISIYAKKLAEYFWPEPLTILLNKNNNVSDIITGDLNTVAIRVPKHPVILEVIDKLGNGIVAPSANAHQKTSPTKPIHVLKTLNGKIPAILDGGMSSVGIESTIIDMTKDVPTILRYGIITKEMIEEVLQLKINSPINHNEKISGNMQNHYQPEKPLFLISTNQIEYLSSEEVDCAIMHYSDISKKDGFIYYKMSQSKEQYAKHLYNALHEIDNMGVDKIFVEKPPELVRSLILFDARRARLRPISPLSALMFEADDTTTDVGVIAEPVQENNAMRANLDLTVIKPSGAFHASYIDGEITEPLKKKIYAALDWFLGSVA